MGYSSLLGGYKEEEEEGRGLGRSRNTESSESWTILKPTWLQEETPAVLNIHSCMAGHTLILVISHAY